MNGRRGQKGMNARSRSPFHSFASPINILHARACETGDGRIFDAFRDR